MGHGKSKMEALKAKMLNMDPIGPKGAARCPQRRPSFVPREAPRSPRRAKDGSQTSQEDSGWAKESPNESQRASRRIKLDQDGSPRVSKNRQDDI